MDENVPSLLDHKALEKAAKYICNQNDGLCPMVVENMVCKVICTTDTLPWHCWVEHFKDGVKGQRVDDKAA